MERNGTKFLGEILGKLLIESENFKNGKPENNLTKDNFSGFYFFLILIYEIFELRQVIKKDANLTISVLTWYQRDSN